MRVSILHACLDTYLYQLLLSQQAHDDEMTLMRRVNVASTSVRRHSDVMCLLSMYLVLYVMSDMLRA